MKKLLLLFLSLTTLSLFSQTVSVYRTTANGSERLTPQTSFQLNNTTYSSPNIKIEEGVYNQTMEGFGFTLTNASAELLMNMSTTKRAEVLNEIFNPTTGINSSMVRIPIGSCDLSSSLYSYNDNTGNTNMSLFNFGPDANHLIPILKQIKTINPNIKILATPWSAPIWMKTKNEWGVVEWLGGSLRDDMRSTYALYLKTYLQKMNTEGLKVWGLSVQNEPGNKYNFPAMTMTATQMADFIDNYLYPAISTLSFGAPIIIGHEHNCYPTNTNESAAEGLKFALDVGNASTHLDGLAFHLYDPNHSIESMTTAHNTTGKDVYFTEQITNEGYDNQTFNDNFGFHMEKVVIGSVQNWSKTVFTWNLAHNLGSYHGNNQPGPTTHKDVCKTCVGAVTIDGSNYSKNSGYYIIGQIAKFVDPGAKYIKTSGSTNDDYKFKAAFENPDGSKVLIFWNNNSGYDRNITVNVGTKSFSYTIPKRSAITFKWTEGTPVAPVAPTNLSATVVDSKVNLNWSAITGASSYDIYRSTSQNGTYSVIKSNLNTNSFQDINVTVNSTYFYKIKAKNNVGSSGFSNTASITVTATVSPIAPTGLTASDASGTVNLSWSTSSGANSYDIYRSTTQNGTYSVIKSDNVNTNYKDINVTINSTYFYKIKAKNTAGTSGFSNTASVTVSAVSNQIVANGYYRISNSVHNQVITSPNSPDYDAFMANNNDNDDYQVWKLVHIENDIYTFQNKGSGNYMGSKDNWCGRFSDIRGAYTAQNTNIRFKIISAGGTKYSFQHAFETGACSGSSASEGPQSWDINGGGLGAQIHTYDTDIANSNQRFDLTAVMVGLNEKSNLEDNFTIYPIPTSGSLTISMNNSNNIEGDISILDVNGKVLKTVQASSTENTQTIDVSGLGNGIFYIQLFSNNEMVMKKIVISEK